MASESNEYELVEARSEISRHHRLISELRDGLSWALERLEAGSVAWMEDETFLYYQELLNRQVG